MAAYVIPQHEVASSHIARLGYDVERQVLALTFKSGAVWHYANIPYELAENFFNADSKGRFYTQQIKSKYPAEKMTGLCPKCGALGLIGNTCDDCGTAEVERDPRAYVEGQNGRTPIE